VPSAPRGARSHRPTPSPADREPNRTWPTRRPTPATRPYSGRPAADSSPWRGPAVMHDRRVACALCTGACSAKRLARARGSPGTHHVCERRTVASRDGAPFASYLFICKARRMQALGRVTPATLDVLNALVWSPEELHGFALAKEAHRPTGSVYIILSRLEAAGWVDSHWESLSVQDEGRPRRRLYRLNPDGLAAARQLLAKRASQVTSKSTRPKHLRRGILPDPDGRA
jgi:PadR family transcriptional regulator, regulatory protein PadR